MGGGREGAFHPIQNILEVGIKPIADGYIAAVVDIDRRLDEAVFTKLSQDPLQQFFPVGRERCRRGVVREMIVVFVHKLPRTESTVDQFCSLGIVTANFFRKKMSCGCKNK